MNLWLIALWGYVVIGVVLALALSSPGRSLSRTEIAVVVFWPPLLLAVVALTPVWLLALWRGDGNMDAPPDCR